VDTAWLGPVQLVHERIDHAFNYRGTPWRGARVFFSYLPGCGEVFYDNRPVGTSALVTHRWNAVERVNSSDRINLVIAAIDEEFLREYLAPLPGLDDVVRTPNPVCYTSDAAAIVAFQRTVYGVLQEVAQSPALLDHERLRAGFQQRVLDAVVTVAASASGSRCRLPAPSTRAYIVGRTIDFIEAHLADPISIRDMCAAIRVCPRTLSYAFAGVLGASPKSYLMATRLNRAFRDLADGRAGATIESIAARWGFSHMGRFAKYYRAAFGERPSDTYRKRGTRGIAARTGVVLAASQSWHPHPLDA
jgi:AraC family ethanolamine operon transcriptional activator